VSIHIVCDIDDYSPHQVISLQALQIRSNGKEQLLQPSIPIKFDLQSEPHQVNTKTMSSTTTSTTVPPSGTQTFPSTTTLATRALLDDNKDKAAKQTSLDATQGSYAHTAATAGQSQPGNPTTGAVPITSTTVDDDHHQDQQNSQQEQRSSFTPGYARQQSWSMQDLKHETLVRDVLAAAPTTHHQGQNYSSTAGQ
jgi:hypothetical protein